MTAPVLTPEEVKLYIQDRAELNYLLPGEEFGLPQISLAIGLAIDMFNMGIAPITTYTSMTFPSKSILLYGTLARLFQGQAALYARNQMDYSDGGITLPVEERTQYYTQLATMYDTTFNQAGKTWKTAMNIEEGFGGVFSDYAGFPLW